MSEAAQSESTQGAARAADVGILGLVAELCNAADNDRIHAQHFSDPRSRSWIGTVAIGEVLLSQDLVQGLAFNHRVAAVFDQVIHQKIGNTFTHVHVLSEDGCDSAMHCSIIKIEYRYALLAACCRRRS